ncbi:helix-turn-helix transcriptional regulator [Variovorax sp. J22G73]|uniref:helix-turn-helix domain-containing protein n=1 Tax=unclassified Variovorax TaxID=663243 RepID=UPI0025756505|nr:MULTISPECIES: helix-turn-helix transcriptional regulator [unclassified Variovorax]MDM0007483.1 helix-turn-helix transcriptional regulator [Variovorax sp. J22R203]MDM0100157.1 helix-turn-helix transcriptional regulator [Variovorax sp. J22G73]
MTVNVALRLIENYMTESKLTQMDLSRLVGIPQSTLSRALRSPRRITDTHRRLCKYANISLKEDISSLAASERLRQTIADVWDGTDRHADALIRLLRAASDVATTSRA